MIGIKEFAFELGSDMRTVEDIASICPAGEAEQMRSIGLERIPADNERMLWDMIEAAYQRIETKPDCILIAPFHSYKRRQPRARSIHSHLLPERSPLCYYAPGGGNWGAVDP